MPVVTVDPTPTRSADRARGASRLDVGAAALPIVSAAGALAAGAYVALDDPAGSGGVGACPVHAATGWWCPGCGLTRALHYAAHGDVVRAASLNALAPLVVAVIAVSWFVWLRVAVGAGVPRRIAALRTSTYVCLGAVLVAFTVVRNLPGWAFLRGG